MTALERIMQMKKQGYRDRQIIDSLRAEGVSPKEINDALSQSEIKSEVVGENQNTFTKSIDTSADYSLASQIKQTAQQSSMQPSVVSTQKSPQSAPMPYGESQEEYAPEGYQPYPMQDTQQYEQYQEAQSPEYPQYSEYRPTDLETINEIASQIVEEKNESLKKQITTFSKFKEETAFEIEKLNQRLQKIESLFNELQLAILRKIGEYGQDIKNISKEMHATQESFSKVINPLMDISKGTKEEPEKAETNTSRITNKTSKRTEPGFENYLR